MVELESGIVDEDTIAARALVLMAVGIRERWKSRVISLHKRAVIGDSEDYHT